MYLNWIYILKCLAELVSVFEDSRIGLVSL